MARLAKPIYESLPAAYLLGGAVLLVLSYRYSASWWSGLGALLGLVALVGGLLAAFAPLALRIKTKRTRQQVMWQWLINSIAGIAALALGLWFYGVDGKMMSYTALVVAQALSQFVQLRAWRK